MPKYNPDNYHKTDEIDLGLALLQLCAIPGEPLTSHDQACWCGVTRQRMDQIYQDAVRKLRRHLLFRDPETWTELRLALSNSQKPAKKRVTKGNER